VAYPDDRLGDHLQSRVAAKEVVHVHDRADVRVLDRHDRRADGARLERREDVSERARWDGGVFRKERDGRRLRVRAGQTLIRDLHRM